MKIIDSTSVQTIRSNFIAIQSFFLGVGAILINKRTFEIYIVAGITISSIWYIWFDILKRKNRTEVYYIFEIGDRYNITLAQYLRESTIRKRVKDEIMNSSDLSKKESFRENQQLHFKIDILIPIIVTLIWIAFIIDEIISISG